MKRSEIDVVVFPDGVYGLASSLVYTGQYDASACWNGWYAFPYRCSSGRRCVVRAGDGHQWTYARRDDDYVLISDLHGAFVSGGLRLDDRKPDAHRRHRVQFHSADFPAHDLRRGGIRRRCIRAAAHRFLPWCWRRSDSADGVFGSPPVYLLLFITSLVLGYVVSTVLELLKWACLHSGL